MTRRASSDKAFIFPNWHDYKHQNKICKICIVSNKIRFKAIHHLQYRENVHFRTHAQKEYGNVLEMKSIPILNILALLLFF